MPQPSNHLRLRSLAKDPYLPAGASLTPQGLPALPALPAKHALIALLAPLAPPAPAITCTDSPHHPNQPHTRARYAPWSTARITAAPEIPAAGCQSPPTAASNDLDFHFVMLYSI